MTNIPKIEDDVSEYKEVVRFILYFMALITALAVPINSLAQTCATTEYGEEIILYQDGTWEVVDEERCEKLKQENQSNSGEITKVLIGAKRYEAGKSEVVFKDLFSTIEAQVVDKNGRILLVLWANKELPCSGNIFGSPGIRPNRDARILFSDGEIIRFIDRGKKGVNRTGGGGSCRQYIMYRITSSEAEEIKGSRMEKILMKSKMEGTSVYNIDKNGRTLSRQIKALGL